MIKLKEYDTHDLSEEYDQIERLHSIPIEPNPYKIQVDYIESEYQNHQDATDIYSMSMSNSYNTSKQQLVPETHSESMI